MGGSVLIITYSSTGQLIKTFHNRGTESRNEYSSSIARNCSLKGRRYLLERFLVDCTLCCIAMVTAGYTVIKMSN